MSACVTAEQAVWGDVEMIKYIAAFLDPKSMTTFASINRYIFNAVVNLDVLKMNASLDSRKRKFYLERVISFRHKKVEGMIPLRPVTTVVYDTGKIECVRTESDEFKIAVQGFDTHVTFNSVEVSTEVHDVKFSTFRLILAHPEFSMDLVARRLKTLIISVPEYTAELPEMFPALQHIELVADNSRLLTAVLTRSKPTKVGMWRLDHDQSLIYYPYLYDAKEPDVLEDARTMAIMYKLQTIELSIVCGDGLEYCTEFIAANIGFRYRLTVPKMCDNQEKAQIALLTNMPNVELFF